MNHLNQTNRCKTKTIQRRHFIHKLRLDDSFLPFLPVHRYDDTVQLGHANNKLHLATTLVLSYCFSLFICLNWTMY